MLSSSFFIKINPHRKIVGEIDTRYFFGSLFFKFRMDSCQGIDDRGTV